MLYTFPFSFIFMDVESLYTKLSRQSLGSVVSMLDVEQSF